MLTLRKPCVMALPGITSANEFYSAAITSAIRWIGCSR